MKKCFKSYLEKFDYIKTYKIYSVLLKQPTGYKPNFIQIYRKSSVFRKNDAPYSSFSSRTQELNKKVLRRISLVNSAYFVLEYPRTIRRRLILSSDFQVELYRFLANLLGFAPWHGFISYNGALEIFSFNFPNEILENYTSSSIALLLSSSYNFAAGRMLF
jgi:hypothetical protein